MQYPDFSKILFLDIETVSQEKNFDQLSERMQKLWTRKAEQLNRDNPELTPADIYDRPSTRNSAKSSVFQ